jgi:hypothetical protein
VKEDRRTVGGEGWQEKMYNSEEWKKLLENGKESSHSAHVIGMNGLPDEVKKRMFLHN